jgi:hypothetical protein
MSIRELSCTNEALNVGILRALVDVLFAVAIVKAPGGKLAAI